MRKCKPTSRKQRAGTRNKRDYANRYPLRVECLETRKLMTVAQADFNGDGYEDIAAGVPYEDVGSIKDAGAVHAMYGSPSGISGNSDQIWSQNSSGVAGASEAGDRFGEAVVAGDFNGDGYDDLAIGVPYEDIGSSKDAGAVHVLYGSSSGLRSSGSQLWYQGASGVAGWAETGDRFGQVLAAGDFNHDGIDDLAIGVPMEDVGSIKDAGAVNILYGSRAGITAANNAIWDQNSFGIEGASESGDRYGWSLAVGDFDNDQYDDLAIGVPLEDVGSVADAGAVNVMYGSSRGLSWLRDDIWDQNSSGISGFSEPGDHFGFSLAAGDFNRDGRDDLAIGVPHENAGSVRDAGGVNIIYGALLGLKSDGNRFYSQNSTGVEDTSEHRDHFGFSLISADFNSDGYLDLAVGVPGEDVGSVRDAGAVNVLYGTSNGISSSNDQIWHQNISGIVGTAEQGDQFGMGLAAGDFNRDGRTDLIVGIPYEDVGLIADAGGLQVIRGAAGGLTSAGNKFWSQNSTGMEDAAEANDQLGHFGGATSLSEFQIDLNFKDFGLTSSQQQIFVDAARRWSEVILGDLPDANVFTIGMVDDVWIDVIAPAIDGPGKILGSASPWAFRSGSNLPTYGLMRFDSADVDRLESNGGLFDVVLHEMGHVLGIGTLWQTFSVVSGVGTSNPTYTGSNAVAQYNDIFNNSSSSIPVANTGGAGTRDAHWRESVFGSELMTGFLSSTQNAALSRVTVGSLLDLGYEADLDAADLFAPFGTSGASSFAASSNDSGSKTAFDLAPADDTLLGSLPSKKSVAAGHEERLVHEHVFADWIGSGESAANSSRSSEAGAEQVDELFAELGGLVSKRSAFLFGALVG